jgi:ABC-type uncharacterized transport system ATPase subunit
LHTTAIFKSHQLKELKIWCNNAKHFKNQELFYDLYKFGVEFGLKKKVNLFAEKHEKIYCDGRVGVIKRFIRGYTLTKKRTKLKQHRALWLPFNTTHSSHFKIKSAEHPNHFEL